MTKEKLHRASMMLKNKIVLPIFHNAFPKNPNGKNK